MPLHPRFATLLLVLTLPALFPGLSSRVMAQTTTPVPLLQVEGTLQADDGTLPDGSFYDVHEFTGQADQTVTILLESEAFDAYLILEDDQGNRIATNNNISLTNTNAALITTLTNAGRYRVIANTYQADFQGPYQLTIRHTPADKANPLLSAAEVTLIAAKEQLQAGIARFNHSEFRAALALWETSLELFRAEEVRTRFSQESRQGEANSLGNLGSPYYSLGDYDRAIDFFQERRDIIRAIGDRQGEATSLSGLGIAYYSLGEYGRAIDFHQQALDIARAIGDRQGESTSLHNLGLAFRNLDDLTAAEQHFQASAHVQESLHSNQLADANRLSLLDSQQKTYHLWQVTLMALGQPKVALTVAERGRAQALAVSMIRSLNRETETFESPASLTLERIQAIAGQQNATLVEYSVLPSGRILIWVIQPDGTIQSTESNAAALDEALVESTSQFVTLGQNSRGSELTETPLSTLIQDIQTTLTHGGSSSESVSSLSRQQLDTQLQKLHKILIEPISQWLPKDEQQRVIFIPHRELFRVPFAALRDREGQYLIQHHTILTAPSIQSLELARQHRIRIQSANTTDALIVGNPHFPNTLTTAYGWQPLPGAEREAHKVSTHLSQHLGKSSTVLLHDQATETQVKEQLHSARFIHLATHGNLVSVNEKVGLPGVQYSFLPGLLALAASDQDDGSLTADELRDLTRTNPLNAELVVLSACQTGQGRVTSDGVDGLSRTLLTAGVPTMLVSLWNASDHHTVELMDEFYRQFLEEDQDKAQALRQAMLQMIEQGDDNPQHWAAFTLVGEAE